MAALACALLAIAAIGLFDCWQLRSTSRAYEDRVDRDARLTKVALELKVAVDEEASGVRGYILLRGDDVYAQTYQRGAADFGREMASARAKADSD